MSVLSWGWSHSSQQEPGDNTKVLLFALLACASVCGCRVSFAKSVTPLVAKGQQALGSKPWNQGLQCPHLVLVISSPPHH